MREITAAIKEALGQQKKEIVFTTILGSSVLAAILGVLGQLILVPYQINRQMNADYEKKLQELNLQNLDKKLQERRAAYAMLDKELERISSLLNVYVSTCGKVRDEPANLRYVGFAQSSWDSLTSQLGEVRTAKMNCQNLNGDDSETRNDVEDITDKKLGVNLFSTEVIKSKERNPELLRDLADVQRKIAKTRERIKAKSDALVLKP